MLADELDYVVGVDTHRDQHVLAIVDAHTGAVIAQTTVARHARGYADAVRFADGTRPASECGRSRAPATTAPGLPVTCRPRRGGARGRPHQPRRAAAARQRRPARRSPCRPLRACEPSIATPRAGRAPGSAAGAVAGPAKRRRRPPGRARPAAQRDRHRTRRRSATSCDGCRSASCSTAAAASAARSSRTPDQLATILVLRSLARRIQAATARGRRARARDPRPRPGARPELLDEPGVGPIVAAQLIVTWSHHDRINSEAAFARLAGVAPLPASSGLTTRHRLSRGGDRQLNRALHTVILHRRQHDPATSDYIARRVAEGKTSRDATRLLKRYLARHLYRVMQNSTPLTT